VMAFAKTAKARGTVVVLNAAPAQGLPEELLNCVDILVVNEVELTQLAGEGAVPDQLQRVATLGIQTVIVTLGAQGCLALHEGQMLKQAGFKVQVVDTTAAGDTFCGSLVATLAQQRGKAMALQNALRMACAASALACTRMGAQSSIPTHDEVMAFLAKQRD
jgi:ribokinase